MQTSLLAIANKAKDRKHYRFLNLYRLIGDENFLLECWSDIRKNAAYGVDRVSAQQYGENLIENIRDLIDRLKRKSYRARLVQHARYRGSLTRSNIVSTSSTLRITGSFFSRAAHTSLNVVNSRFRVFS